MRWNVWESELQPPVIMRNIKILNLARTLGTKLSLRTQSETLQIVLKKCCDVASSWLKCNFHGNTKTVAHNVVMCQHIVLPAMVPALN